MVRDEHVASDATRIVFAKLTRAEERLDFVRGEVRRAGASISPEAAANLLDAVGSDLREVYEGLTNL